jgi:hypothetical protein
VIPRANAEYDLQGLSRLVSRLSGALFSNGEDGDLHRVLKVEGGQLAWDISERLGPASKEKAEDKAERDVKRFLTDRPVFSNLGEDQQYSSMADFTWLEAGPGFLVGINDEDNQVGAGTGDAAKFFRGSQKAGSRGKAYIDLGKRGKQHVYRLNRTRVSRSALRSVVKTIKDKFGTLRASFAFTAAQLLPQKRVPVWISRHFATNANGRSVFDLSGLSHPTEPFLEFGSTAPGVESNPEVVKAIHEATENRKVVMEAKMNKVLDGYAYDYNTGAVFNRREAKGED